MIRPRLFALAALGLLVTGPSAAAAGDAVVVRVGRLFTMDEADHVYSPGMVIAEAGKLTYVGPPIDLPAGAELHDWPAAWAVPGMVDLHTHIHTGSWVDINDMVRAVNPELRVSPTIRPANLRLQIACASGVTTLLGIPGSGTNMGGFGVLYKSNSGVIPQEEFFLQGAMSARYGGDPELMLRALTIHPARAFGIDDRVGSLEVGKDADLALRVGDPLDPRSRVELVLIEGEVEYDRTRDGTWF